MINFTFAVFTNAVQTNNLEVLFIWNTQHTISMIYFQEVIPQVKFQNLLNLRNVLEILTVPDRDKQL